MKLSPRLLASLQNNVHWKPIGRIIPKSDSAPLPHDGAFNNTNVSDAIGEQGGTITIALKLSKESRRAAGAIRDLCSTATGPTNLSSRTITSHLSICKPLPASRFPHISATLQDLASRQSVFNLTIRPPVLSTKRLTFPFVQSPMVQKLQKELLKAFSSVENGSEGLQQSWLLDPKFTVGQFDHDDSAAILLLKTAQKEFEMGIRPLTIIALSFRYWPLIRCGKECDPHNIDRSWQNFTLVGAEKVELQQQNRKQQEYIRDLKHQLLQLQTVRLLDPEKPIEPRRVTFSGPSIRHASKMRICAFRHVDLNQSGEPSEEPSTVQNFGRDTSTLPSLDRDPNQFDNLSQISLTVKSPEDNASSDHPYHG